MDHPIDNIHVNEENGNLWLALFNKPAQLLNYFKDTQ